MTSLSKENQQYPTKNRKRITIYPYIVTFLFLVAVLIFLFVGYINNANYSLAGCQKLNDEAQQLIDERKYEESYDQLTSRQKTCSHSPKSTIPKDPDAKVALFRFQHNFAMASDGIGEEDQAKEYAEAAIKTNKSLRAEERMKDSRHIERVFNVVIIADGGQRAY